MTQEAVSHRRNHRIWLIAGIIFAVLGLSGAIIAMVFGNTWNADGGAEHGALQAAILIVSAFALGAGVLGIILGLLKDRGSDR